MITSHDVQTPLPDLLPTPRLARTAGPRAGIQENAGILRTPTLAPRANAFAERWVGTVRRDTGSGAGLGPTAVGGGAGGLCGALQRAPATPRARAGITARSRPAVYTPRVIGVPPGVLAQRHEDGHAR